MEESIFLRDMVETFENEIQVKNAPGRAFRVTLKLVQQTVVETVALLLMRYTSGIT